MERFSSVFQAHPDIKAIYVTAGQPFLKRSHADSFARSQGAEVTKLERSWTMQLAAIKRADAVRAAAGNNEGE